MMESREHGRSRRQDIRSKEAVECHTPIHARSSHLVRLGMWNPPWYGGIARSTVSLSLSMRR